MNRIGDDREFRVQQPDVLRDGELSYDDAHESERLAQYRILTSYLDA